MSALYMVAWVRWRKRTLIFMAPSSVQNPKCRVCCYEFASQWTAQETDAFLSRSHLHVLTYTILHQGKRLFCIRFENMTTLTTFFSPTVVISKFMDGWQYPHGLQV